MRSVLIRFTKALGLLLGSLLIAVGAGVLVSIIVAYNGVQEFLEEMYKLKKV